MPVPNPFSALFSGPGRPGDEDLLDDAGATAPPPRPEVPPEVKPGDDVVHGGAPARVVLVHPPGGVDAVVDLVLYRGRTPEVVQGARHDYASGWGWPWEAPPPPPTLGQRLAALRKAGVRIPRVGDVVVSVWSSGPFALDGEPYVGHRARVLEVQGVERELVAVRLALFELAEAPVDPLAPDPLVSPPRERVLGPLGVGARQEGWAWPGWKSPRRLTDEEKLPRSPCSRCGSPWPHQRRIAFFASGRFGGRSFNHLAYLDAFAHLCDACAEAVHSFATTPPASPPASAS